MASQLFEKENKIGTISGHNIQVIFKLVSVPLVLLRALPFGVNVLCKSLLQLFFKHSLNSYLESRGCKFCIWLLYGKATFRQTQSHILLEEKVKKKIEEYKFVEYYERITKAMGFLMSTVLLEHTNYPQNPVTFVLNSTINCRKYYRSPSETN